MTSDWLTAGIVMVCAGWNVQGSYALWRDGLHCQTCARRGRPVYAVLLTIASAMTASYFVDRDWVTGISAVVITGAFMFDLAFINRYLDRQESL